MMAVLLALTVGGVSVGSAVIARHRAQSAADLAALAAAAHLADGSRPLVATGREAGGLTGRIDATHLHRHRGEPRHAQDENNDQRSDRERRLNGDAPGLIG